MIIPECCGQTIMRSYIEKLIKYAGRFFVCKRVVFFVKSIIIFSLYNMAIVMADTQISFKDKLDQIFEAKTWGVIIADPQNDEILYSLNADLPLIPASNQKIITLLAALEKMELNYKSYTEFYRQGLIVKGTLEGDLIVKGKGAIHFSARYPENNSILKKNEILEEQLDSFAEKLRRNNIQHIQGRIIIDNSEWTDDEVNPHYPTAGALTFNENTLDVEVKNRNYTTAPEVYTGFLIKENYKIDFQSSSSKKDDIIYFNPTNDSTDYWRLNKYNTNDYYVNQIKAGLRKRGIGIQEDILDTSSKEVTLLLKLSGISVEESIESVLTYSDNLRSELLFLNLGYLVYGKATYQNGRDAVFKIINALELDLKSFSPYDGSGLDLRNQISAYDSIKILNFIYKSRWYKLFKNNLAKSGTSGTLKNYLTNSEVKGKIFAKSGTHDKIKVLSGFMENENKTLSFTFIGNFEEEMNAIPVIEQAALVLVEI